MKKVLITGGAGYIGLHTALSLINNKKYKPIIVDNFSNSSLNNILLLEKSVKQKIIYYKLDLRNKSGLRSVFNNHKISYVIHLASKKNINESIKNPFCHFNDDILSTLSLLECMIEKNVYKIIFSSSASVYNCDQQVPLSEDADVGKTLNPYATSKYILEKILIDIAKYNPKLKVLICRYFNIVGSQFSSKLKKNNSIKNESSLFDNILYLKKSNSLKIYGNNYNTTDGTAIRDYLDINDLTEVTIKFLKYFNKIKNYDIFNIGSGKGISVYEIFKKFKQISKVNIKKIIYPKRKYDIAISISNIKKLKKELMWRPKVNIKNTILKLSKF
jgi:UDP-glucose 4-epimerase